MFTSLIHLWIQTVFFDKCCLFKGDTFSVLQDETESKLSGRGDSAVSKGTADSGVVMENQDVPSLPGMVPDKLRPLTSDSIRESEMERVTQEGELFQRAESVRICHKILTFFFFFSFISAAASDVLQEDNPVPERLKSSEILEELLSQGIIPGGQSGEKGSGAAYTIMVRASFDLLSSKRWSFTSSPVIRLRWNIFIFLLLNDLIYT